MKKLILFLSFLAAIPVFGQTKKETEDWLTYYLNKYYFFNNRLPYDQSPNENRYVSREFFFRGNNLVAKAATYETESDGSDSLIREEVETVNLSDIIKVYSSPERDSICYICLDGNHIHNVSPVLKVNLRNIEDDTEGFDNNYIIFSTVKNAKKIAPRIVKAFRHLILLDNGKPLKEVF